MPEITHDGSFNIAIGKDRNSKSWQNRDMFWSELVKRCSKTHRTPESQAEYAAAKKDRQDEIKDIGGFVGGVIAGKRRLKHAVTSRQLITLDIDHTNENPWDLFRMLYGNAALVYSSHKHTSDLPRLRLVMPLSREVDPEEYEAICRKVADDMDIEIFDITTFQPSRLMYWPSTSEDGEYFFEAQDGPWLDADAVLSRYRNWKDSSQWPVSIRVNKIIDGLAKKQGNPLEKPGIVGVFCRTNSITEAIQKYLSEVYEPCDTDDRFTYINGSTSAGLVIYDDTFSYSHHGTDPTSQKLCNAFDLVRLHLFGIQDEDAKEGTPGNRMPSFTAMVDFALKDPAVRMLLGKERTEAARAEFDGLDITDPSLFDEETGKPTEENKDWLADLKADRTGKYYTTTENILLILENDTVFRGRIAFDDFEKCEVALKKLAWRTEYSHETRRLTDEDDANIRHYLETVYGISSSGKIDDALIMFTRRHKFHPVKDYLRGLDWDGEPRLDTLLIDYMGAEDCEYVRTVTRKTFTAAVARIYKPGIKFDFALTFVGDEGLGKSTLGAAMGGRFYSDNFSTVTGKESIEQIQGAWIVEMAELSALKNAELETTKHYISRREDRYRVAYGKRVEFFPRQCIFIGTTEKWDFLKRGYGGNRRWWPVVVSNNRPKDVFNDLTQAEVDQVWAEAVERWRTHETLFLDKRMEKQAKAVQETHRENDDRSGIIHDYLEMLLPENWDALDIWKRKAFIRGDNDELAISAGTVRRNRVCAAEIWCEVLEGNRKDMTGHNTKFIHDILRTMPGWEPFKDRTLIKGYGNQKAYFRVNSLADSGAKLTKSRG